MTRPITALLAATVAVAACSRDEPGAPRPESVDPATGFTHRAVAVVIRGAGFHVRAEQDAGGARSDLVDARFRAWLDATELADVERLDEVSLRATVPAGIAAGPHDLTVQDPWGRRGTLAGAYSAVAVDLPVLSLVPALSAPAAVPGQRVDLAVSVSNGGGDDARAVAVSVASGSEALAIAPPPSQDVPAGSTRTFVVGLDATAPGMAPLVITATGTDALTGDPVTASAPGGTVAVLAPAALSIATVDAPPVVESGTTFPVEVSIANDGEEDALAVAVDVAAASGAVAVVSAPAPRDVAGKSAATFAFLLRATAAGAERLSASGRGAGALSGQPAATPVSTADVAVVAPPALRIALRAMPRYVSVGQRVVLTADVEDVGGADAAAVSAELADVAPGFAAGPAAPAAQDVPAGAGPRTFTWTLDAVAPSAVTPRVTVAGTDAVGGGAVGASASAADATWVQTAAAPLASALGPAAPVGAGQAFAITATITNLGQASCALAPSIAVAGDATVAETARPDPVVLAGGASVSLAWTFVAQAAGTATLAPRVDGTDANSGAPVSAAASPLAVTVLRPAALRVASLALGPDPASVGQPLTLRITVENAGGAQAIDVAPSAPVPSGSGSASLASGPSPAPPVAVPAGGTASFAWTYTADAPGTIAFAAGASGRDAATGAALTAADATSGAVTVQRPASLSVALVVPAAVSQRQTFPAKALVTNTGGAVARAVSVDLAASPAGLLSAGAAPPAADVAAGATVAFSRAFTATATGSATIAAGAAGSDANDGRSVTASASAGTEIQSAASPVATASASPSPANVGQPVTVTLTATNLGGASCALTPSIAIAGSAALAETAHPDAATLPGGSSASFVWSYATQGPGTATFTPRVDGTDANSGAPVAAAAAPISVTVQRPAQLRVAALTLGPDPANVAQPLALRMTVENAGGADAVGVAPSVPAASGTASATPSSGPSPVPPIRIPGGTSATFAWTYAPSATGSIAFTASASGSDANTGTALSAAPATSAAVTVQRPASLSVALIAPATVDAGQTFKVTARVTNGGDAIARAVSVDLVSSPAGMLVAGDAPATADVAPGATVAFERSFTAGTTLGPAVVAATASGTDGTDGRTLSASGSASVAIQSPAAPSASAVAAPSPASTGQTITLTMTVTNLGQASCTLTPSVAVSGTATLAETGHPDPVTLGASGSASLSWTFVASGAGSATFTPRVDGNDLTSGAAVSAQAPAVTVQVQRPAQLRVAALTLGPDPANVAQPVTLRMIVENAGGTDATAVAPSAPVASGTASGTPRTGPTPAPPVAIPAGGTAAFEWTYAPATTGSLAFTASASGRDAITGATVSSPSLTSAAIAVQRRASLSVAMQVPTTVNRNQTFTARALVTNGGDATARTVSVDLGSTPAGRLAAGAAPPAADLAAGATVAFERSFTAGTTLGAVTVTAAASGTDGTDGLSVSASGGAGVTVQAPAALSATLAIPSTLGIGDFTATMTVVNTGGASVTNVDPGALSIVAGSTASVALRSSPAPDPGPVPAGEASVFTWTWSATSSGTLQLSGAASATDANDRATVLSPLATSNAANVATVVAIASDPFLDGATYTTVAGFGGKVYLATNETGDRALRTAPNGSGGETLRFVFEQDVTSCDPSNPARQDCEPRNSSTASPQPRATSIGYLGCISGTPQCGPDDEAGRALLFSGVMMDGLEWLFIAGSRSGSVRYLYATSSAATPLDFSYIDVQQGLLGFAQAISAVGVIGGRLYVAHTGGVQTGTPAPPLRVLTTPPGYPGIDPPLYGSTLLDLHAEYIPGIGTLAGHAAGNVDVDAMAEFNSFVYVANDGGIARATSAPAAPATASGGEWVSATPSSSRWTGKSSVALPGTMELETADHAVPALAAFGGRLFAIRNTTSGPQLWRCDPGVSGIAAQCDPGDWSLAAPNATGDTSLTQLGDPGNARATLLVATPTRLYVGFNNAGGLRMFRTTSATPAASDFEAVGGPGLDDPIANTRIYDAKVLTFGGTSAVYVSVGNGVDPVRVYRLND